MPEKLNSLYFKLNLLRKGGIIMKNKILKIISAISVFFLVLSLSFGLGMISPKKAFAQDETKIHIDSFYTDFEGYLWMEGWAANLSSIDGTGIARIDVYLDGFDIFLGEVDYGMQRGDVADYYDNENIKNSGWELIVDLTQFEISEFLGSHTIDIYAINGDGSVVSISRELTSTIEEDKGKISRDYPDEAIVYVDYPSIGEVVSGTVVIRGWAANPGRSDTRVVVAYPILWDGANRYLGDDTLYYSQRPDVAEYYDDPILEYTGWASTFDTTAIPNGTYDVVTESWEYEYDPETGSLTQIDYSLDTYGQITIQN